MSRRRSPAGTLRSASVAQALATNFTAAALIIFDALDHIFTKLPEDTDITALCAAYLAAFTVFVAAASGGLRPPTAPFWRTDVVLTTLLALSTILTSAAPRRWLYAALLGRACVVQRLTADLTGARAVIVAFTTGGHALSTGVPLRADIPLFLATDLTPHAIHV